MVTVTLDLIADFGAVATKGSIATRSYRLGIQAVGLRCFERSKVEKPESQYIRENRYGYMDGKQAVLTYGYGITGVNLARAGQS